MCSGEVRVGRGEERLQRDIGGKEQGSPIAC